MDWPRNRLKHKVKCDDVSISTTACNLADTRIMARVNPKQLACMPNDDFGARTWLTNFAMSLADAADVRSTVGINASRSHSGAAPRTRRGAGS